MKLIAGFILSVALIACRSETKTDVANPASLLLLVGTWQLLTGTLIKKEDTTVTHYRKNISFQKVINATHFAFLQHDLNKGKDSEAVFVAGGGPYTLKDSLYTEHLEYLQCQELGG